jgi:hypothetical protein
MPTYYKLLDNNNYGTIVSANGRLQYKYKPKEAQWIRSGVMLHYFSDESDRYGLYEEITTAEAMEITGGVSC